MAVAESIEYPVECPPEEGYLHLVATGIYWLRMPLSITGLDHINLWLLEDDDAYTVIDTGMCTDRTMAIWDYILNSKILPRRIKKIICTHHHPDHMGMAGWLQNRTGASFLTSKREWLYGRMMFLDEKTLILERFCTR